MTPLQTCSNGPKIRYASEHAAKVALVGTVIAFNRGKGKRKESRYYRCPYCKGWHLTSTPEKRK